MEGRKLGFDSKGKWLKNKKRREKAGEGEGKRVLDGKGRWFKEYEG